VSVIKGSCIDMVLEYNVQINPVPAAGNDGVFDVCGNAEVNLEAYLSGNYMPGGIWEDADQSGQLNGSQVAVGGLQEGTYRFNYVVTGCDATDTATIVVNVLGSNAFEVQAKGLCLGDNYTIGISNVEAIGPVQDIEWEGPEGFSYSGTEPFIDITNGAMGTYYVTVTTTDGCTGTGFVSVSDTFCKIPKGISPNADTLNDTFDLSNLGVLHLVIFNRYGMNVFEADNYIDEWHGQSDSGDLPTGAYYYVATLSAGMQKTGWVYLQREIK
jgi:gliding motility-associated-like protein